MYRILRGRVERFAVHYNGPKFHALLCDPPYHLYDPATRRPAGDWDGTHKDPFQHVKGGGFMGQKWDGGDIAFRPDTWAALAEHLLPGAFGMAFAAARGWHRLACAIEDAGLRIHPSIFGWNYASGFPKATRIDTQIDKKAGGERTKVERVWSGGSRSGGIMGRNNGTQTRNITAPATDLAKTWAGHRYGLQALKPALEPIIVFQKPYKGKPVDSITETGAGALWIDGARIPGSWNWGKTKTDIRGTNGLKEGWAQERAGDDIVSHPLGRWPANFYIDEEAARRLGEQSGLTSKTGVRSGRSREAAVQNTTIGPRNHKSIEYPNDAGTAARFFLNVDWKLEHSDPVLYCPKANRKEREAGLGELPLRLGGMRSETSGQHITRRDGGAPGMVHNHHPTVKPLKLTRWLATLLLPPEEYAPRRILVPFAGSGSEMIGAVLAGWEEVIGVEMEREYCEIANARLEHWSSKQSNLELFT